MKKKNSKSRQPKHRNENSPPPFANAKELLREQNLMVSNGLADALGVGDGLSGFRPGSVGTQLSQVDTLFANNRWYLVSNMRQLLCEIYVELGLVQTIVNVPVDDAFRGGIEIKTKQLSEDQIHELATSTDRDNDINAVKQGEKWNRLFGGAGILILTDQDPETPLDLEAINPENPDEKLEFRAVDMWELFWDKQNTEGYDPEIQTEEFEFYNYYAKKIHKSRVIRLKGLTAPSFIRPRLRGWGFSVVEALVRSMNQYLKATDLTFEVLDEFKIDIFQFKNLTSTLFSAGGDEKVRRRADVANRGKNYNNAIVLDADDKYEQKQLSFSGLAEVMDGIKKQVAADMRMPISKLFGQSYSGMAGGSEDDIEVYNSMVEGEVREKVKYNILRVLEIKCQKLFGFIPDDLEIEFKPLRVLSAVQEEEVKTQKFNRVLQASTAGKITDLEFREACNREKLLPLQLETDEQTLETIDSAQETEGRDPLDSKDVEDPGANREDTRKPRAWDTDTKKEIKNSKSNACNSATEHLHVSKAFASCRNEVENKVAFDCAAYSNDGGDAWIGEEHKHLFMNPGNVDEALWKKAEHASEETFGEDRWPFVTWWYKKHGGTFNEAPIKNENKFVEGDHPRAKDGKFGKGGGSSAKGKKSKKPSKDEARSIRFYTGSLSSSMIDADRGTIHSPEIKEENDRINKYLGQAEKYKGNIYRGIVVEKDEIKGLLDKYKKGTEIEIDAKQSWTKDPSSVKGRLSSVAKEKEKPVKVFFEYPESDNTVDVSEESRFPEEQETIMPKGSAYKVKEVIEKDGEYRIVMEKAQD